MTAPQVEPTEGTATLEDLNSDLQTLSDRVDGKAATDHGHAIDDVTSLQAELDSKAATDHSHAIAEVTGLQAELNGKAATDHSHAIGDVTGLQAELDGKSNTGHNHTIDDVTGLQAELDGKAATDHDHTIADVIGLQAELDGKTATGHSHVVGDVTGLQAQLNEATAKISDYRTARLLDSAFVTAVDANDHVLAGQDADGRRILPGIVDIEGPYRTAYPDGVTPVAVDATDKVLVGQDPKGRRVLPGVVDIEQPYRTSYFDGVTPVVVTDDSVAAGLDANGIGFSVAAPPMQLRNGQTLFSARSGSGFLEGMVNTRDGFVSHVRQRNLSNEEVAVCVDPRPMHFAPMSGQSNAINGGAADVNPRKIVTPLYPNHFVGMAEGGVARFITPTGDTFDPQFVDGFLPFQDFPSSNGQGAMVLHGFGVESAYRAEGAPSPGIVGYTSAKGGSPLTEHNKGTLVYANMLTAAEAAKKVAARYGRDLVCHAVRFIQGEGGPYTGYQALLEQLGDDYQDDLVPALGGNNGIDPVLLISQVAVTDTMDNPVNVVPLDQVAAARNRPDIIKIDGPMYINRMDDSGIHGATDSKVMIHEAAGYAYRQLVETGSWEPLWSVDGTATRTGAEIVIDYNVPGIDKMLEWDPGLDFPGLDGWIKPITNYGFHYTDDSSGVTIDTVAIESVDGFATRVRVTLTGDPGAATGKTLSYARHAYDTDPDLWASARGQLRCRLERCSLRDLGLPLPRFKYAYALAEEWSV